MLVLIINMKDNNMKMFYKLFLIFLLLPIISLIAGDSNKIDTTMFNFKTHSIQFKVNSFSTYPIFKVRSFLTNIILIILMHFELELVLNLI